MLLFNENYKTIILDSIDTCLISDYAWVLDYEMMDYRLTKLDILEEVTCPCLELELLGFKFVVPTDWFILIFDEDTSQMDLIKISDIPGRNFTAVIYGHNLKRVHGETIKIVGYHSTYTVVRPSLNKNESLCHPVSPDLWINIGPGDSYGKQIRDCVAGDLINFNEFDDKFLNKNAKRKQNYVRSNNC